MSTVRLRRLQADYEKLRDFARRQPRLRVIAADGQPPELYQLEYQITGLRQIDDQLQVVRSHMVEIRLPRDYPRTPPQCRMLTPVFHPNIAPHAICIGDHWSAGEPLWSMVARIGEMIAYQSYNTKSPLNGEAARWVEQNLSRLPLDRVNIRVDEPGQRVVPTTAPAAAAVPNRPAPAGAAPAPQPAAEILLDCPGCGHRYRVPAQHAGKRTALLPLPKDSCRCRRPPETMSTLPATNARQSRHRTMLAIACGVVVLSLLLHVRSDQRVEFGWLPGLPMPEMCWSRSLFGAKCPGCGLTRSLVYLAHGDWRASLTMHRLGMVMALAILAQFPYCTVGILYKKDYPLGRRFAAVFAWGLIALLIGNWLLEVLTCAG